MNRIIISLCLYFSMTYMIFAQNYVKHVVVKGETITQIAAKYRVTPYDIYKLNPDSQSGIKESDIILVPSSSPPKSTASQTQNAVTTHIAKPKETLYSISRDFNVNVDELKRVNPELKDGLKIGQTIKIPTAERMSPSDVPPPVIPEKNKFTKAASTTESAIPTKSDKAIYHIVEAKETKFGIAKKYGLTVEALEKKNPAIVSGLPVGYKLVISGNAVPSEPIAEKPQPVKYESPAPTTTQTTTTVTVPTKFSGFANYEVKPKETLFSLAQMFDITQDELIMLNPTLKEGVKTGMILKVPGRGSMTKIPSGSASKSIDLTKSIKTGSKKQLVLLLPFNAAKIQGDTLKSVGERLKKDAFLNMTLDFYSGALMAIDSAKTLGMNLDVKIFDSEESKMSSNVAHVVQSNKLENADAVIGPFYQQYVEKVAELLNSKNVPVISPLSKESGKTYSNLFQAMPPADCTKSAVLDFMVAKQGNIIVVSDSKRMANKEFITKNYPTAKFNALTENGGLDTENLKSLLVKDQINYVIMDSEKTGMILGTTTVLLNEMANFQIQLAIIEPNETLDFEEISMKRLTILKMIYPSLTNEKNTLETMAFENAYKRKNKIFPSQYAVRGFDVTFDTMLRLSQDKSFHDSANDDKTEQVESKFEYAKKDTEGYVNKGIYILEYQDDLSVKQVN